MHSFLPDADKDMLEYSSDSDDEIIGMDDDLIVAQNQQLLQFVVTNDMDAGVNESNADNASSSSSNSNNNVTTQHQQQDQAQANTDTSTDAQPQETETNGFVHMKPEKIQRVSWQLADSDSEEEGATAEEIFNIEPAIEATRDQPPDIHVGAEVVDVKFHPSTNLLAVATLDAEVVCYKYSTDETSEVYSSEHHDLAVRAIHFSKDGSYLLSVSKDKSVAVIDTETFNVKRHYKDAHEVPVYSVYSVNENIFATGDDEGTLKLWDMRRKQHVFSYKCGEDTVNGIISDDAGKTLVAAVNDGSIAAFNCAKRKLIVQSEMYDYPMSCLAVVRNGTRLAVGSDNGVMHLFKWGEFSYHVDNVTDAPQQLNCMEAVGDNRLITGCEDGYIRAVNLYPHRFVGVVGRHQKYGVEGISVSCDQRYLASCNQDDTVLFWDLEHLYGVDTDPRKKGNKIRDQKNNLRSARERNIEDFFADMTEDIPSDEEYTGPVDKPKNVE